MQNSIADQVSSAISLIREFLPEAMGITIKMRLGAYLALKNELVQYGIETVIVPQSQFQGYPVEVDDTLTDDIQIGYTF